MINWLYIVGWEFILYIYIKRIKENGQPTHEKVLFIYLFYLKKKLDSNESYLLYHYLKKEKKEKRKKKTTMI